MRALLSLTLLLLGAVTMTMPAASQQITKPERGSVLRTEILDAANGRILILTENESGLREVRIHELRGGR